jgi:hypothetical protein
MLTDFTVPNKIYDYKNAGLVTVMSDNPALVEENKCFEFGLVYSVTKNNLREVLHQAREHKLADKSRIQTWEEALSSILVQLVN